MARSLCDSRASYCFCQNDESDEKSCNTVSFRQYCHRLGSVLVLMVSIMVLVFVFEVTVFFLALTVLVPALSVAACSAIKLVRNNIHCNNVTTNN